jgi:hypothetical protein
MTMDFMTVSECVRCAITSRFPKYPVSVERDPDDDFFLCVYLFYVPSHQIDTVEEFVYNECVRVLKGSGFFATVFVKDEQRTQEFYPEYVQLAETMRLVAWLDHLDVSQFDWQEGTDVLPLVMPSSSRSFSDDDDVASNISTKTSTYRSSCNDMEYIIRQTMDFAEAA